jgi:hypothetical protein
VLLALLLPAACSGRITPPPLDADEAGRLALQEYDLNKDGALDAAEAGRCPALLAAFKTIDKNGDGKLSAGEIAERVRAWQATRVGLVVLSCQVLLDDRPLPDATLTLTPEKLLGPSLKPATGVTDQNGLAHPRSEGAALAGVACGLYRVEISKKTPQGQERLPARYNSRTTLGLEVAPDSAGQRGTIRFRLTGSP